MADIQYAIKKPTNRPFFHTDIHTDLERLITVIDSQDKPVTTLVDKYFVDKQDALRAKARRLHREIEIREALDLIILNQIDSKVSELNTRLMGFDTMNFPANDPTRIHIINQIHDLETQKRREYLEAWKDLLFLTKELLPVIEEIFDMMGKTKIARFQQV